MQAWAAGKQPKDAQVISKHDKPKKDAIDAKSRDIFCYFDNTDKLWAPYDARKILAKLDLIKSLPAEPGKLMDDPRIKPKGGQSRA